MGNVGLSAFDRRHGTAWTYYWLTSAARGRGYPVRALATVAAAASGDGLFHIELGHRVNNPASCKVATGAGFIPEGVERQKLLYGAERFDVETHARLLTDSRPGLKMRPIAVPITLPLSEQRPGIVLDPPNQPSPWKDFRNSRYSLVAAGH